MPVKGGGGRTVQLLESSSPPDDGGSVFNPKNPRLRLNVKLSSGGYGHFLAIGQYLKMLDGAWLDARNEGIRRASAADDAAASPLAGLYKSQG